MKAFETPNFDKVTNNPWAIELAMNSRGMTESELAEASGLDKKTVKSLIKGDVEADINHIQRLSLALNYPAKFFQQWFDHRLEFGDNVCMPKNVEIKYEDYKIMGVPKKSKKVISFMPDYVEKQPGTLF